MQYQLEALAALAAVIIVYAVLRRQRKLSSIRDVPGPVNPSWLFGMLLGSTRPNLPACKPLALNANSFKDTNGTSKPERLGQRTRGSSRTSGTLSAGMVLLGYVLCFIKRAAEPGIRTLNLNHWCLRAGEPLVDCRPESNQPHHAEIWVFLYEAERRTGADSVVGRSQGYRIGGGWVGH